MPTQADIINAIPSVYRTNTRCIQLALSNESLSTLSISYTDYNNPGGTTYNIPPNTVVRTYILIYDVSTLQLEYYFIVN
jgi:hypothetical protein